MTDEKTPEQLHEETVEAAIRMGWDENKYAPDDPKYKTAEQFVEFGEKIQPILRSNLRRLEDEVKKRDAELASIREEVKKFGKLHEETQKKAYEQALADLKAQKKVALEEGDFDSVVDLDEQIADIKAEEKAQPAQVQQTYNPEKVQATYNDWLATNKWCDPTSPEYKEDLDAYARGQGALMVQKGMASGGEAFPMFLKEIEKKVRAKFPDEFENTRRQQAAAVEGGGASGARKGKHTYADLPQEAKEVCDFYVSTGNMTREQYLAAYPWNK